MEIFLLEQPFIIMFCLRVYLRNEKFLSEALITLNHFLFSFLERQRFKRFNRFVIINIKENLKANQSSSADMKLWEGL